MTHTGEKKHQCCDCERAFFKKSELIRHQKCHLGEKPYRCAKYGKTLESHSS